MWYSLTITFGTIGYHLVMRLLVGLVYDVCMKNRADYFRPWYRQRSFEPGLYEKLRVRMLDLLFVISYITWIGWLVAFFLSEKDDRLVRHHLNQALVINVIETVGTVLIRAGGLFAVIGEIIDIAVLVFFIMGISRAAKLSDEPLPIIGGIHLIG